MFNNKDIIELECIYNISVVCCILISDILTIELTCYRYIVIQNEELCQYVYNQTSIFVRKIRSLLNELSDRHISSSLRIRMLRSSILLEDLVLLLRRALVRSVSSRYFISLILLIINLLRMLRILVEDLYSSLVTTFDKHTKFID